MGREIKRVPANFDWPLNQTWKGYLNPYRAFPCRACQRANRLTGDAYGDGRSPAAREIADTFYDLDNHRGGPNGRSERAWADKLTQEEVNLLVDEHRLYDFGGWKRVRDDDGKFVEWERVLNDDGTPYYPTAAEVNAWERGRGMGHDGINRSILIDHRLKKAGLVGDLAVCSVCEGEGCLWFSEEIKQQAENFGNSMDPTIGEIWTEPPTGEWWQVWETVSEGSPVSPPFATPEELIDYLVEGGDAWTRDRQATGRASWDRPPSREAATRFVLGTGWVPSVVVQHNPDGTVERKAGIGICEE